jgi:DNA invertase Pin-like site-specific DNA recombinase
MILKKDATTSVGYSRVSDEKQGFKGLGLKAQEAIIKQKSEEFGLELVQVYKEVESGSRSDQRRPVLKEALEHCKRIQGVLIISTLDRLSRNFNFLTKLAEASENGGIGIIAGDVPQMGAPWQTTFMWRQLAIFAEMERNLAIERTTNSMKILKANIKKQGYHETKKGKIIKVLGNPQIRKAGKKGAKKTKENAIIFAEETYPVIEEIRKAGITGMREIARQLNYRGVPTYQAFLAKETGKPIKRKLRNGQITNDPPKWGAQQVIKLIERVEGKNESS